jgi:Mg2+ and Co2+ transporter CorA
MHDQGDVLANFVRQVTARINTIEDKLLAGRLERKRADLGVSRRLLVRLQRLLAPEPAALFRLLKKPPPWTHEDDIEDMYQSSEEFSVALSDIAALRCKSASSYCKKKSRDASPRPITTVCLCLRSSGYWACQSTSLLAYWA